MDAMSGPPQDLAAEQAVLGSVMLSKSALEAVLPLLRGSEFYRPAHTIIWEAIKGLERSSQPVDAVMVAGALATAPERTWGGAAYLHTLIASVVVTENVTFYVAIVKDKAARRKMLDAALSIQQEAYQSPDPIEVLIARAEERLRDVPVAEPDLTGTLMSLDEFCDQEFSDEDWIIPDLLDRGDRLILTGTEGLGKTYLMRQFAVCAAAGVHPFTFQAITPRTALFVDVENPAKIMRNSFRELRANIHAKRGPIDEKRLWIERAPAGLDLGDPTDVLWLQRLVSLVRPDLLCIGPAYKLYKGAGKASDEDLARNVTSALDAIRESVNCALILEHHPGHGDSSAKDRSVRPFGSSLWLRWPEFGFGIRPAQGFDKSNRLVDLLPWRGSRDERAWPSQLAAGSGFLPWVDATYS